MRGITRGAHALTPEPPQGAAVQNDHRQHHHEGVRAAADLKPPPQQHRGGWAGARDTASAAVGAALGLLPHLLHHISLFAGALVVTGAAGNLVFGTLGLLLSIPLLRRLYRRFATWKAPALALAAFAAMFSLSAFVIGPALSGGDSDATATSPSSDTPEPGTPLNSPNHNAHHGD